MFNSYTARQLGGAVGGIAIAGLLYVTANYIDFKNIQGYLVQPGENISENAGVVRTNVKTPDDTSFERLARRAAAVEAQLQAATKEAETVPQTALNQNAEARKQARLGTTAVAAANANPTEYMNTNTQVSQYDRLALRTARLAEASAQTHAGAPVYQPKTQVITPEDQYKGDKGKKGVSVPVQQVIEVPVASPSEVIIKEVQVPTPPQVVIKEVLVPSKPQVIIKEVPIPRRQPQVIIDVPVYGKNLADSGLGLNLLLVASFLGAVAMFRPDLRKQFIASFARAS